MSQINPLPPSILNNIPISGFSDVDFNSQIPSEITLNIPRVNIAPVTDYSVSTKDAFRIIFKGDDPYLFYLIGRALIAEDKGFKFFLVAFDSSEGHLVVPVQIPLVGQNIEELVSSINQISGLYAEVLNNSYKMIVTDLLISSSKNITRGWANFGFEKDISQISNNPETDIKFYYTSLEAGMVQNNPSQSIGGYISATEVYKHSFLLKSISFYDSIIYCTDTVLKDYDTISIGDEIIKISSWNNNSANVEQRSTLSTIVRYHPAGAMVKGIQKNNIFNSNLSSDGKQYRCFAIKNTSNTIIKDIKVFAKFSSRNNLSSIRLAIELPKFETLSLTVSSGGKTSFVVSSLSGIYPDGYFNASSVFFFPPNTDQIRKIISYNGAMGIFDLDNGVPNVISAGSQIRIETFQAQRIFSGTKSPNDVMSENLLISKFRDATYLENAIGLNITGKRSHGSDLYPDDVFYIWIERSIDSLNDDFQDDRLLLSLTYK